MAGQQDNRMRCAEFDALLSQAIDGTLAGERLQAFEAHGRECKLCGPLLEEAEAGHKWLKSLAEVDPPEELVTNILLRTSGVLTSRQGVAGRAVTTSWMDRVREWGSEFVAPVINVARQPRFAMSFGMAFFTLSVTLSLAGVRLSDLRHLDLRPSAIRRSYYETQGRVVKYYENIRFVYEIESRVRQFKQAATPAEQPREEQQENNRKDQNKSNTSGQPDQKQERNYSQEGNQPVFASLPEEQGLRVARFVRTRLADPPVVTVTTYRRFV
jgi:Putative zinc-finger